MLTSSSSENNKTLFSFEPPPERQIQSSRSRTSASIGLNRLKCIWNNSNYIYFHSAVNSNCIYPKSSRTTSWTQPSSVTYWKRVRRHLLLSEEYLRFFTDAYLHGLAQYWVCVCPPPPPSQKPSRKQKFRSLVKRCMPAFVYIRCTFTMRLIFLINIIE